MDRWRHLTDLFSPLRMMRRATKEGAIATTSVLLPQPASRRRVTPTGSTRRPAQKETRGWSKERSELDPTTELPDDTPISDVKLPTRIQNALTGVGLKTVGEVREISDENLLSLQDLGKGSVALLRETL